MAPTQLAHDPEKYKRTIHIYEALRAIIPRFREKRVFLRATEPITPRIQDELDATAGVIGANRDRVVCALANKACNTHRAVRVLTDGGHGDDAMALGRVLLENAALLNWLLIDSVYRLELYAISDALYRRRWRELVEEHYQSRSEVVAQARAQVDSQALAVAGFFGNTIHKWAQVLHPNGKPQYVNFEEMMKENAAHGGSSSRFQHDVIYFLHSSFVHSTASSMRSFRRLRFERYFTLELGPNSFWCEEALGGANIFLFQILQSVSLYMRFEDIEAELDALFVQIKADSEASVKEPTLPDDAP